jgi:RimJ/RimL family protein N-acetyltransferase
MTPLSEVVLENAYARLEPLDLSHAEGLEAAAADGQLWNLWFTSVPPPGHARGYIEAALKGQAEGRMLPFAIREKTSGLIAGTTRYYDIMAEPVRVAIGYTWYAKRWQRSHLNTACKQLLLKHAFEQVGAVAVEFHTDAWNFDSQRAIERLGAKREGVLRAHRCRPDGSLRDTVCYSVIASEWPDVDRWLGMRLARLTAANAVT